MYVTATELKNNLGSYLERVRDDEAIIITKNGEPIARIIPFVQNKKAALDSLVGLVPDLGLTIGEIKAARLLNQ